MSKNFLIPLVLDYTAKAYVYGESGPALLFNYAFSDVSGVITLEQMRNTFKYKDSNNGITLKYNTSTGITSEQWHNLITNQILSSDSKYRNSYSLPVDGPLSNHIIQWISSTLFGHPQAQAPLTNEEDIINDVSNGTLAGSTLGQQIYSKLSESITGNTDGQNNEIVQSIYEQMVNEGRFNIGSGEDSNNNAPTDTDGFLSMPFKSGDKLSFLININCDLINDSSNTSNNGLNDTTSQGWSSTSTSNLQSLFSSINGVKVEENNGITNVKLVPEVWKFTFVAN